MFFYFALMFKIVLPIKSSRCFIAEYISVSIYQKVGIYLLAWKDEKWDQCYKVVREDISSEKVSSVKKGVTSRNYKLGIFHLKICVFFWIFLTPTLTSTLKNSFYTLGKVKVWRQRRYIVSSEQLFDFFLPLLF